MKAASIIWTVILSFTTLSCSEKKNDKPVNKVEIVDEYNLTDSNLVGNWAPLKVAVEFSSTGQIHETCSELKSQSGSGIMKITSEGIVANVGPNEIEYVRLLGKLNRAGVLKLSSKYAKTINRDHLLVRIKTKNLDPLISTGSPESALTLSIQTDEKDSLTKEFGAIPETQIADYFTAQAACAAQ